MEALSRALEDRGSVSHLRTLCLGGDDPGHSDSLEKTMADFGSQHCGSHTHFWLVSPHCCESRHLWTLPSSPEKCPLSSKSVPCHPRLGGAKPSPSPGVGAIHTPEAHLGSGYTSPQLGPPSCLVTHCGKRWWLLMKTIWRSSFLPDPRSPLHSGKPSSKTPGVCGVNDWSDVKPGTQQAFDLVSIASPEPQPLWWCSRESQGTSRSSVATLL